MLSTACPRGQGWGTGCGKVQRLPLRPVQAALRPLPLPQESRLQSGSAGLGTASVGGWPEALVPLVLSLLEETLLARGQWGAEIQAFPPVSQRGFTRPSPFLGWGPQDPGAVDRAVSAH